MFLLFLAGCTDPDTDGKADDDTGADPGPDAAVAHPLLVLSDASIDFGDVGWEAGEPRTLVASNQGTAPLGIGDVRLGDDSGAFVVAWDPCAVTCEGAPTATCDVSVAVLDPGCELPVTVTYAADDVGDAYDAVLVTTVADPSAEPAWHADLLHTYAVVYLHGRRSERGPAIDVSPRVEDFGFRYPGVVGPDAQVMIENLGDADLTLTGASLVDCGPGFAIASMFEAGAALAPRHPGASVNVSFTATDLGEAWCRLEVASNDPSRPVVDVTLSANTSDARGIAPRLTIHSPVGPSEHDSSLPLRIELGMDAPGQPPTTVDCVIESKVLGGGPLASCTPDEDGRAVVEIDGASLPVGADVLWVTVTDAQSRYTSASFPLRVDTPASADDTDGDGFSPDGAPADCDDADASVYPSAIEGADRVDDDCDGIVDEGTRNYDDDGDGASEADGDCDDWQDQDYPGAPERADGRDNDCDNVIDDETAYGDDDADSFAEIEYDCDDTDAAVHPAADEACDGVDNDCDGTVDAPTCFLEMEVVGHVIHLEQTAMLEGETIWMEVQTYASDGATLTYAWSTTEDGSFDDPGATRIAYTAGFVDEVGGRDLKDLYVSVTHPDGTNELVTGVVAVYDAAFDLYAE